ncbi:hypothetical protein AAG570_010357 [Ranatra chinensis]|uniref:DUF3429 domain-containing protein n=1 Tax=Ranatra chinensis TaxID=642074 RepID=A0ABD0YYD3_9HEMI
MKDLTGVPTPMFWLGVSGLGPMLGLPILFMVTGYCSSLATVQMTFGATICSFLGGVRWGYMVTDGKPLAPTWENVLWSVAPQAAAWLALLLPQSLGLLLISAGIGMSTFIDLITANYPPWFKSLRLFLAIPAIIGLLLTFIMKPFA